MSTTTVLLISFLYLLTLFLVAHYAERQSINGRSIINNPYVYTLSLGVYCTAWTYFGSVGRASTTGLGFLPIYLGPTLVAPFFVLVLRKMILISKSQRITSVADFISSRYGKSTSLGILATLVAIIGVIPYISIQLKAIGIAYDILIVDDDFWVDWADQSSFYCDKVLLITIVLAIFATLYGSRKLDPNERHEGLVASVAFESIIKLVAFLAVGIYVTWSIYDGIEDVFTLSTQNERLRQLFDLEMAGINGTSWTWLILLSMSAILFLPRQFHMAVVENTNQKFVQQAAWLFPFYLFLICIFVIPIAFGGILHFPSGEVEADSFVLSLPMAHGQSTLAIIVFIGGLSAATSMVIVSVIALSIMISNNLILPFLLKSSVVKDNFIADVSKRLLGIRRVSMVIVLLLAYGYLKSIAINYTLVSIGLISFAAIAQFAPIILGGLYWKRGTRKGAIAALGIGFTIWFFTLPFPTLIESGLLSKTILSEGLFGIHALKPYALFGLEGFDQISHAAFWSLFFNTFTYVLISLNTVPSQIEITQADLFVDIYKYGNTIGDYDVVKRAAKTKDIKKLLNRFLGESRANVLINKYEQKHHLDLSTAQTATADLVNYTEKHLSGALGAASAKVVISSIVKEDPISLEEMFKVLDQTQEVMEYSKALEKKSNELEATTIQLKAANEQLKELDQLKDNFIATVTHELRTPITSMKAFSKILLDNPALDKAQQQEFLSIIVSESDRIGRLINQVLDLRKLDAVNLDDQKSPLDLSELIGVACQSLGQMAADKEVELIFPKEKVPIYIFGNRDKIIQVWINLVGNALKFVPPQSGCIRVSIEVDKSFAVIRVQDNGIGIAPKDQATIFDRFTQVNNPNLGKPQGSGLGLFITKKIVEQHQGTIEVESEPGIGAAFIVRLPLVADREPQVIYYKPNKI
ncbi:MAG: ATP-binding protein [Bacteroidota bacterium]